MSDLNIQARNLDLDSLDTQEQLQQTEEAPGSDVTDEQLRDDATTAESWLHYNKGLEGIGYSPADRITRENVDGLSLEYTIQDRDEHVRDHLTTQVNPIVVPSGGDDPPVMYYSTALQEVHAVNARNGEHYWSYAYEPEYGGGLNRGGTAQRGVAVYGDKVYLKAADVRVVAIDRYTGEPQWRTHALSETQREEMEPRRLGSTGAPLVFDGKVLLGQSGGGGGWGAVLALDAESGDILWDQDTLDRDRWVDETYQYGDCNMWMTPSVDPETGLAYFPTGNPAPQIQAMVRPGPNEHSDSVIAIDTESGEIEWATQLLAHDWWDYDGYFARLFDMEVDGEERRVIEYEDKTGWIRILDAETGEVLGRSEPYANQGGELPFMGIPPAGEDQKVTKSPTGFGSTDWNPDGYSPQTGLVYICAHDDWRYTWYEPDWEFAEDYENHNDLGGGKETMEHPDKEARVSAINPASGQVEWTQPYEFEEDVTTPQAGGNTPTGGGLVFGGGTNEVIRALDAETGDILWSNESGIAHQASPVVWDDPEAGKQYVTVAAEDTVITYALED
ncbi:PQQ-binding-like beta-propeller repeat protein [Halomontanus rarus]|uniref:outer membrane protein assembly factor BamB family protein n=1 Tax=Halomontanus rarus TaxID=3034020 RepID=UPI0023E84080|nr:PQQ-binding-like beta-propeller repeat protein [Halovivax sp. TS33]